MSNKHYSDCAVNNAPAYPRGECDCGGLKTKTPRTDAATESIDVGSTGVLQYVSVEFAESLEIEVESLREQLRVARERIAELELDLESARDDRDDRD